MEATYRASADTHVLPTSLLVPGVGTLLINAYVILAEEPVLVDTGIAVDGDGFVEALRGVLDPAEIRWVWLTHDDSDHTGNLERVMDLAPDARLVTHGLGALRMATWWPVPLERVHAIRPGDALDVGDRTLTAVRPPVFDNPMSAGLVDDRTRTLFSVDAFGAILPHVAQDVHDFDEEALVGGMVSWATFDSPWTHLVDRDRFGEAVDAVARSGPERILSSHLPAAPGTSLEQFTELLRSVPDADPFEAPDSEAFAAIAAELPSQAA